MATDSLVGGRLRLGSALPVRDPDGAALGRFDQGVDALLRAVTPEELGSLFSSDAGLRLQLLASAAASVSLEDALTLGANVRAIAKKAPFDARVDRARVLALKPRDLGVMGGGAFALSVTPPRQPGPWTHTATLSVSGTAAAQLDGLAGSLRDFEPLLRDAAPFYRDMKALNARVKQIAAFYTKGPEMQRFLALVRAPGPKDIGAIAAAAGPLLDRLDEAQRVFSDADALIDRGRGLLDRASRQVAALEVNAGVRGALTTTLTSRRSLWTARSGDTTYKLSAGLSASLVNPLPNPLEQQSEIPGLQRLRTMMVAVEATADVGLKDVETLRAFVDDAARVSRRASALARRVQRDALSLASDRAAASEVEQEAQSLKSDGVVLDVRARLLRDALGAEAKTSVRVQEAIGPGLSLDEVGARLEASSDTFDWAVEARFGHLFTLLPVAETDARFVSDDKGDVRLQPFEHRFTAGGPAFFPATAAVSARGIVRAGRGVALEARAGVDAQLVSGGLAAHVGLIAHLYRFYFGAGLVAQSHELPTTLGVSAGYRGLSLTDGLNLDAVGEARGRNRDYQAAAFRLQLAFPF